MTDDPVMVADEFFGLLHPPRVLVGRPADRELRYAILALEAMPCIRSASILSPNCDDTELPTSYRCLRCRALDRLTRHRRFVAADIHEAVEDLIGHDVGAAQDYLDAENRRDTPFEGLSR